MKLKSEGTVIRIVKRDNKRERKRKGTKGGRNWIQEILGPEQSLDGCVGTAEEDYR